MTSSASISVDLWQKGFALGFALGVGFAFGFDLKLPTYQLTQLPTLV